jgi:hypothetical protein
MRGNTTHAFYGPPHNMRSLMRRTKSKLYWLLGEYRDAVSRHEGRACMVGCFMHKDISKRSLSLLILALCKRLPEDELPESKSSK